MDALAALIAANPMLQFPRSQTFAASSIANFENGARLSNYFAGADGAGLKSTFGAVEMAFSFSTVKFGFSL
jgi:hypothetical protein